MSYAPFVEGGPPPTGPAHALSYHPPLDPAAPPWADYPAGTRAMIVYAHPDDEILFAGGLMLAYPGWAWSLVCVTDPGRREMEARAHDLLIDDGVGLVYYENLGLRDAYVAKPQYRSAIFREVEALEAANQPAVVFTHGLRGEYGHHHHVWTHMAVHLACSNVWDFFQPYSRVLQLLKTTTVAVGTSPRKREIFDEAYGEVASGLRQNARWLTAPMDEGEPEYFTQGTLGI